MSQEKLRETGREYGQTGVLGSYFVGEEPLLTKVDISNRAPYFQRQEITGRLPGMTRKNWATSLANNIICVLYIFYQ